MNSAVKTRIKNYAELIDQAEDDFLDMPHREITAPKTCQSPSSRSRSILAGPDKRGEVLLSYYEVLMVVTFSIALGAYGMLVYVHNLKKGDTVFLLIDELSKFLLMASLPIAWIAGIYLYYKKRKSV